MSTVTYTVISELQIKTTVRFAPHLWEWLLLKSQEIINVGEGVEKREPLYTADGNVNWVSQYGEQYGVPQKIKNGSITRFNNPSVECELKSVWHRDVCTPSSQKRCFQ
jgi:hypothetical protein